eukprot:scaffold31284_cov21-Tisochrysis_lutea.AAC.1
MEFSLRQQAENFANQKSSPGPCHRPRSDCTQSVMLPSHARKNCMAVPLHHHSMLISCKVLHTEPEFLMSRQSVLQ